MSHNPPFSVKIISPRLVSESFCFRSKQPFARLFVPRNAAQEGSFSDYSSDLASPSTGRTGHDFKLQAPMDQRGHTGGRLPGIGASTENLSQQNDMGPRAALFRWLDTRKTQPGQPSLSGEQSLPWKGGAGALPAAMGNRAGLQPLQETWLRPGNDPPVGPPENRKTLRSAHPGIHDQLWMGLREEVEDKSDRAAKEAEHVPTWARSDFAEDRQEGGSRYRNARVSTRD